MSTAQSLLRRAWRKARKKVGQWTTPPVDLGRYAHESYAQEGEDILLMRLFPLPYAGFYVDVGAHHPVRFSTTYLFYKYGWRGINIDAMPGSMGEFSRLRPHDINLEMAIADRRGVATYYMYREPALNTFSQGWVDAEPQNKRFYHLVDTVEIQTYPLAEILDRYLPPGQAIDFLAVDVEGLDLEVIQSSNWQRYRPRVVVLEQSDAHCLDQLQDDPATQYMASVNYSVLAKTFNSVFYVAREQPFDRFPKPAA